MSEPHRQLALAAAGMAVLAGAAWGMYRLTDAAQSAGPGEAVTLYDTRDARQVAGTADDVFAGTVVDQTGQRDISGVFSDLYEVRVTQPFKGHLHGTVTVSHEQGADPLSPGASYVFTTGQVPQEAGHAVLLETSPARFTRLTAPAEPHSGPSAGRTVAEYWTWAVAHEIDVSSR
ncbi:hypothetical protein ACIBKX_25905 [Streptomyces sp. NPDC050658]|uniref:hypothetical protein n=1 Tax=unclassified Streptomyces TaxID=2593676 RepID=UPI00342F73B0